MITVFLKSVNIIKNRCFRNTSIFSMFSNNNLTRTRRHSGTFGPVTSPISLGVSIYYILLSLYKRTIDLISRNLIGPSPLFPQDIFWSYLSLVFLQSKTCRMGIHEPEYVYSLQCDLRVALDHYTYSMF